MIIYYLNGFFKTSGCNKNSIEITLSFQFPIRRIKEFHPTLFQPSKRYTALNNVITTQISNRAENNMQSRLCRWHTNTHTLHHLHAWHKGKSWFILHLNPLTWKHEHMTLWAHERFWETERKKPSAHIRSSNFPSHFTPQGKRLYSAIQMEPVKGGLYCTSAFPLLPEINSSSF